MTRYELVYSLITEKMGSQAGHFIISLMRPLYLFLKFFKAFFSNLQFYYETRMAPFWAAHAGWLFWPVYKLLASCNICFIVNIGFVTGHVVFELDNFFRKVDSEENLKNKRYVWIRKSSPICKDTVKVYRHKFWFALSNTFLYNLLFPIIIRYKDITLDCGLSPMKWQLKEDLTYDRPRYGHNCLYMVSGEEPQNLYAGYFKLRGKTKNYFPLLEYAKVNNESKLIRFLNGKVERLALIHIKTNLGNSTGKVTDPKTYLPTLRYLSDSGYRIVFVGREKMPQDFFECGVINYANSRIATFEHDIQIFKLAELAITAGSGIGYFPDCFDKPYLFLNSWWLPLITPSAKCIAIPTLVQKRNGEFLKYSEQLNLYDYSPDPRNFPANYEFRNASDDEILQATQELMVLKDKFVEYSRLQKKFRNIAVDTPYFWTLSRISEYFLQKHTNLF